MASILRLLLVVFAIILRVAIMLRLVVPLMYIVLMATVFSGWAKANETLAIGILIALVALSIASWIVTIVRKVRE